jgi:hypothetical protein
MDINLMDKKYYLSAAAIFKNESMGLKEWIDHNKFHGIDHIYLIDDGSDDDYISIIQPYIDSGYITLFENMIKDKYKDRQYGINNLYFKSIYKDSQWFMNIDIDEFIYSPNHIDVKEVLKKYESYASLVVATPMFNSNNHKIQPESIVGGFTKRISNPSRFTWQPHGSSQLDTNSMISQKIIVNSDYDVDSFEIHVVRHGDSYNYNQYCFYNFVGKDERNIDGQELLINHYQLQSREYWEKVKLRRGDLNYNFGKSERSFKEFDIKDNAPNCNYVDDYRLLNQNKGILK